MDFNVKSKLIQTQIAKHRELLMTGKSDLSLTHILSTDKCQDIIMGCRVFRDRIYTPFKILIIFIKQVINPDKSCKNAVAGVVAEHLSVSIKRPTNNTGPYCKARERLSEVMIKTLAKEVAGTAGQHSSNQWRWRNRNVHVVDGTTLTMPDTENNSQVFLRHKNYKGEVALPMVRLVVLLSLTVGTILDYALGAMQGEGTGEHSLLRSILNVLNKEDFLLGDAYYPSFFLLSDLLNRGLEGVFVGCNRRNHDFRCGKSLGKNDHIVEWKRPVKPNWMDEEIYAIHPKKIFLREFRVGGRVYITTFLSSKKYNKKELSRLYDFRWQVEITLRDIKRTMKMEMLSCKSAEMVKKEIGVHVLGYNLIRILMAEACMKYNAIPHQVSFKGSLQLLNQFLPYFSSSVSSIRKQLFSELLRIIVTNKVAHRPGRVEPRALKTEKRNRFCTMKEPRAIMRNRLLQQRDRRILKYGIT